GRPLGRRGGQHGLRRRLPDLPRQEVRGVGTRRSGRQDRRGSPPGTGRDRATGTAPARPARRTRGRELMAGVGLARRALAEGVGTGLLVVAVVGSGIMAARLSPGNVGLELLENSIATAFALAALILAFGPVSGAHFNPAVSLAELATGKLEARAAAPYIGAQLAGGCAGAIIANLMFELPAVQLATKDRISS